MNFIVAFLIPFGTLGFFFIIGGIHVVHEGHIGVYSRGGALLPGYNEPGIHTKIPIITKFWDVQITIQTDKVLNIPCGTSGGVMLSFDKIEVVNRLKKNLAYETIKNYTIDYDKTWIFDKIHHEINQFCSSHTLQEVYITKFDQLDEALKNAIQEGCNQWAPGIEIIAVRVTKPNIPENIRLNYEKMEDEKTRLLIAKESQLVQEKESETQKILEKIDAETKAEISKIQMEQDIIVKEISQKLEEIDNQINLEKQKGYAEASYYKNIKDIEINNKKFSKDYLENYLYTSLADIPKVYYGKSIPEFIKQNIPDFN